jgi:hypothetical protein
VTDKNPEQVAWDEAKSAGLTLGRWLIDHGRRYLTASLLKFILTGVIFVGVGAYSLPVIAVIAGGVAILGGIVYGIYGQRIAHDERASRRWTWISAHRLRQDKLRLEQRLDAAVFDLLGRAADPSTGAAHSSPELRQAVAVLRHQALQGQQRQVRGGQPEDRPAPKAPDLKLLQARMVARKADIDAIEAEIQSLAVPENADAAMVAQGSRDHEQSLTESVRKADQVARERVRRGQTATNAETGVSLQVELTPTGTGGVQRVASPPTPEQIAQGRTKSHGP